jgi:hypothetical protein
MVYSDEHRLTLRPLGGEPPGSQGGAVGSSKLRSRTLKPNQERGVSRLCPAPCAQAFRSPPGENLAPAALSRRAKGASGNI